MIKTSRYKKSSELLVQVIKETIIRDTWAEEISKLKLPKIIEQVALNTWKEQNDNQVCLHSRTKQNHLISLKVHKVLAKALTILYGTPINLTIIDDDNLSIRTPLEWQETIYKEKLVQAYQALFMDSHIQMLKNFFDAKLDEDSISIS